MEMPPMPLMLEMEAELILVFALASTLLIACAGVPGQRRHP
jgi:hypothetical protein